MSTSLHATLMIGPDAAVEAKAHVHANRGEYTPSGHVIAAVHFTGVADLTIQTDHLTGPDDLAAFFDALAAKVRDAHAAFIARHLDPEGDPS